MSKSCKTELASKQKRIKAALREEDAWDPEWALCNLYNIKLISRMVSAPQILPHYKKNLQFLTNLHETW